MGENEISEMFHYTIYFLLIILLNVLIITGVQVSQVQTVQHNIEATLSKNGGYTHDSLVAISNNKNISSSNKDLIPIKGTGWIYLSKSYANDAHAWANTNSGVNPKTTNKNTKHWDIKSGVEQENTIIPYKVTVKPFGAGSNNFIMGWFPEMSFKGTAQSQVYTGNVV